MDFHENWTTLQKKKSQKRNYVCSILSLHITSLVIPLFLCCWHPKAVKAHKGLWKARLLLTAGGMCSSGAGSGKHDSAGDILLACFEGHSAVTLKTRLSVWTTSLQVRSHVQEKVSFTKFSQLERASWPSELPSGLAPTSSGAPSQRVC